jgi:hypothetical protein
MKIEFFSDVQGLTEAVPIYRADKNLPQWVTKAREDYLKSDRRLTHIFKCPGIFELYSYGFVVPMWFDAIIKTENDRFAWIGPEKLKNIRGDDAPELLTNHSYLTTAKHLPIRPQSIANIIKIDTPWNIIVPKGLKFLAMAYPYPDSCEFEACPGILDPSISSEVNVQLYWNVKNQEHMLKAGTPLMMLIPLTQEKIDFEVRDATERDMLWIKKRNYLSYFKLTMDRSLLKTAYNNFFNKGKR